MSVDVIVYPTGDGDITSPYYKVGGTYFWQVLDDPAGSPDEYATYTYAPATHTSEHLLFTFSAPAIPSEADINYVRICWRCDGNSVQRVRGAFRINGTGYFNVGATQGTIAALVSYYQDFPVNPATGSPWTREDIAGNGTFPLQQFGVHQEASISVVVMYTTQIYMVVNYSIPVITRYAVIGGGGNLSVESAWVG